jgi:hypothetical protein
LVFSARQGHVGALRYPHIDQFSAGYRKVPLIKH